MVGVWVSSGEDQDGQNNARRQQDTPKKRNAKSSARGIHAGILRGEESTRTTEGSKKRLVVEPPASSADSSTKTRKYRSTSYEVKAPQMVRARAKNSSYMLFLFPFSS